MNVTSMNVIAAKGLISGKIQFNKPIASVNYDSIFYQLDSAKTIKITHDDIALDSATNLLTLKKIFDKNLIEQKATDTPANTIKKPAKSTVKNRLYIGKAAFISVELDSSVRLVQQYDPIRLEDTGIILVEVQTNEPYFLVELLTKDFKVVDRKRNVRKFNFEDLKPGDYQLRLVIDTNNNGYWSPGNYYERTEPERIIFYKTEKLNPIISLKANWELGPLLITE